MVDTSETLEAWQLRDAVFEAAPHCYLVLNAELTIIDVNQQYLDLTRTRREDLVDVPMFDAFPDNPADPTADGVRNLRLSLETARATGRPHAMAVQKYDIPLRGPEGGFEERYWKPLNTPVLREGEVVALIHHVIDVTEETIFRRDQAIRLRSAQRLDDLAFWEYDPRTETTVVSRAFATMLGLPEREGTMPARECFTRIDADDRADVQGVFDQVMDAPDHTTIAFTHRLVLPDGKARWLSSHGELVRDHRNALPRFVVVSMDITGSKQREEKLAEALDERDGLLAQKEALLAEVNHRIKNSLQLVSSILNTDAHRSGEGEVRERLERAAARVQAVTSVHEMLYRSNEVTTVSFGEYLHRLCANLASGDAGTAGLDILCEPTEVKLPADKAIPLALIVNELTTNAVKHGLAGASAGVIKVATRLEDDELVLEVTDNGTGKVEGAQRGMGTRIIDGLVKQLAASMSTGPAEPGYRVVIRVPLKTK
ncbi:putative magnesium or manganese-dependent protein phosphatase [Pseudooceanicola batsensis HTCC2597]|uniref:histidine kinase n=1 Tax=Pseudooceanicola batsensis (strain ATCC BAA-863 / DSM 15984 / KCTC 12145 / HTCC2597) TaxID=252305 RepID=A3U0K2_PSEBH|nr:histidine kinase dimerization/phosphoacceptor domain -containing protein [Pseudooceanicola batsensis]EAQ02293.1 putative magnesium or manganese-dependent protein phosphatase [Pseudooceanicola batsensis HTCC2597]